MMASIARDPRGRKRILFVAEDGRRKTIRLGKTSIKQADAFKLKLEAVIAGRYTSIDAETARWIAALPDAIHGKLAAAGLVTQRAAANGKEKYTIGEWVGKYIASRSDVKPITIGKWQNAANKLSAFFKEKPIGNRRIRLKTININAASPKR